MNEFWKCKHGVIGTEGASCPKCQEQEKTVTVCSECRRACCWQGEFMCDLSSGAGTVEKTIAELSELKRENPDYWMTHTRPEENQFSVTKVMCGTCVMDFPDLEAFDKHWKEEHEKQKPFRSEDPQDAIRSAIHGANEDQRKMVDSQPEEWEEELRANLMQPGFLQLGLKSFIRTERQRAFEEGVKISQKELRLTERLLEERQRVLDSIPDCPIHGECVPYALEWIEQNFLNNQTKE